MDFITKSGTGKKSFGFYLASLIMTFALVAFTVSGAVAADFTLSKPSTDIAVEADTTPLNVKLNGSDVTDDESKILIFTTTTGVLDVTNSDADVDAATSGILTFPDYGGANVISATDTVILIDSDNRVSAPFLKGVADVADVELGVGIVGQTATDGTGASVVLEDTKAVNFGDNIFVPVRSLMTGGTVPDQEEVVSQTGVTTIIDDDMAVSSQNPFIFRGTGDGAVADLATRAILLSVASTIVDAAGNDLHTGDLITIANANLLDGDTDTDQSLYDADGTVDQADLVRVTNSNVVLRGEIAIAGAGGALLGLATSVDADQIYVVINDGTDDYALNGTVTFVNWDTVEISFNQGATASLYDWNAGDVTVDTTDQVKVFVNTDGQSFLFPTTATQATLTEVLNMTDTAKLNAGVDDGPAPNDGIALASMTIDLDDGAFENAAGDPSDANDGLTIRDKAAPWVQKAVSRIDATDTTNEGSQFVNSVDLYFTEPIANLGTTGGNDVVLWADNDADGLIDHDTAAASDEIYAIADADMTSATPDAVSTDLDWRGVCIARIDILGEDILPDTDIRVRLVAAADRSSWVTDVSSNYYEPFLGDQDMDMCRYYLFDDDATTNTTDPDYSTDFPDTVEMTASTYGVPITDAAPGGLEEVRLVIDQAAATSALVYIKFSEPVTILDFDGTADAKNTSANEMFIFEDATVAKPFTGSIYRMVSGKLNDIKTAKAVEVGTTVESDLDAAAGQEFILEMAFPGAGITIVPTTDTLFVKAWGGKILDAVSNSTKATFDSPFLAATAAPSLPAVIRVEYSAGDNFAEVYFSTSVGAVNSSTNLAASGPTLLNDALSVYDGSGVAYAQAVTVSIAANVMTLTWDDNDELATDTGLTVAYDPTLTNNATDEYAVIGNADDPSADYQVTTGWTAQSVETSYTAKTADLNFDGYVDAIIIDLGTGNLLDTTATPAVTGFSLGTTEWKDYNDAATGDVIVKAGQSLNPSSVTVVDHTDATGTADQTFVVLNFDSTFDWNPDTTTVDMPKTDAAGFVTIAYSGTDVKTLAGASVPAFYVGSVTDGAAPAILSAARSGSSIVLDMSEANAANISSAGAGADGEAAGFFIFKDLNGYIMDTTEWDILSVNAMLTGPTTFANYQLVISVQDSNGYDSATIAKQVGFVYISQKYAIDTTYGGGNVIDDGTTKAGRSPYSAVTASAAQNQTYDSLTTLGTKVAVTQVSPPTMVSATALWNAGGYYDKILVYMDKNIQIANAGETSVGNSFLISLDTADSSASDAIHQLKPDAVTVSGNTIVLTISQARQLASAAGTSLDVYPVSVSYTDMSSQGTSTTLEFIQDTDTTPNYMRDDSADITTLANQRTASPLSVEVNGTLTNFGSVAGGQVKAYEAYKYKDVESTHTLIINFEYGPLAKLTQNAFGITALKGGAADQCHQEGVYTGILIADDGINTAVGGSFLDGISVENIVDAGYCYLHTDVDGDGLFGLGLNFDPESASSNAGAYSDSETVDNDGDTAGAGNDSSAAAAVDLEVYNGAPSDSVFLVNVTKKANNTGGYTLTVKGSYGISGSGSTGEIVTEKWYFYDGDTKIAETAGDADGLDDLDSANIAPVGLTVIPIDATTGAYKVVATDLVAGIMGLGSGPNMEPTNDQMKILSRIGARKVILTYTDVAGYTTLLNGVTDDVDIDYYFWSYDGDFQFDPDRTKIFDYALAQNSWNAVPIVVDKVYHSSSKAPTVRTKYPDGDSRSTNIVPVSVISDAIIGLSAHMGGVPVIGSNVTTIFGLDDNGAAVAAAKNLSYLKGGYGYAISEGAYFVSQINAASVSFFGFNMPNETDMTGGGPLDANVLDADDADDARSNANLGWNLMADIADIDLDTAELIDYAITFENGVFNSWISGQSALIQDFTSTTNDYASRLDASTQAAINQSSDANVATGYTRGKAYFLHTADD